MRFSLTAIALMVFCSVVIAAENNSVETTDKNNNKEYDFDLMFKKKTIVNKPNNAIDVSKFKKESEKEYEQVKVDYYHKHEYVSPKQKNVNTAGYCFSITNEDMKSDCLANTYHDGSYCFSINDKNLQNSCLGQVKYDTGYCFNISSKDLKNSCLGQVKGDEGYCFSVNNKDLRNSCLANTNHASSYCFSINNKNMLNACLAMTK